MESRRMSRRRASNLGVTPVKEALTTAAAAPATKPSAKKSVRKALADKTNATPVAGLVPVAVSAKGAICGGQEAATTPVSKLRPFAAAHHAAASPILRGEDVLRSQVHKELTLAQTPVNGLSAGSHCALTPQFRVPLTLYDDSSSSPPPALDDAAAPSEQEAADAAAPEASPPSDTAAAVLTLSSEWVGRDVDDVTSCEDDDDDVSDCSVVVNVSSPGISHQEAASPSPSAKPVVEFSAKWQQRVTPLKVKIHDDDRFCYVDGDADEDYEGCDEYDERDEFAADCDALCRGVSCISVADDRAGGALPEHRGRHVRFNYNSEDEIEGEADEVLHLKGLPTPRGKHLRFSADKDVSSP